MTRERRRHPRRAVDGFEDAARVMSGGVVVASGVDVRDVSHGGLFVDLAPHVVSRVPLGAAVAVEVAGLRIAGRVVRVRLDGRRRGQPIAPGAAIAFAEPHPEAWARLIDALPAT